MARDEELATQDMVDEYDEVEGYNEGGKRRGTFFHIFKYSICQKSREALEGWEQEDAKNPSTGEIVKWWVKRYDNVIARIADVQRLKVEFKTGGRAYNWNFTLLARGKKSQLQLTQKKTLDTVLKRLLKCMPNIIIERPIMISAWGSKHDGELQQAFAIKQCQSKVFDKNPDNWENVPQYWQVPKSQRDDKGKPIEGADYIGADGSKLPPPTKDVDDDDEVTWDYSAQNKFLVKYFKENIQPKIKAQADKLGIKHTDEAEAGSDSFKPTTEIPVVKELPINPQFVNIADAMTPPQQKEIAGLCKLLGIDPEAVSQKLTKTPFKELSVEGASYLTYKLKRRLKKKQDEGTLQPTVEYVEPPKKKEEPTKSQPKAKDEDDEDWDAMNEDDEDEDDDAPPPPKKKKKAQSDDEDDDEDDWDDNTVKAADGGDIPF